MAHHKRRSRRRDKLSYYPCGCCVREERQPPDLDDSEICNGKYRSKRKRPKKDRCPVNRKHEWYTEKITRTYTYSVTSWSSDYIVSTCIHCLKQKEKLVRNPSSWRQRKKIIPKRPVKLY